MTEIRDKGAHHRSFSQHADKVEVVRVRYLHPDKASYPRIDDSVPKVLIETTAIGEEGSCHKDVTD